MYATLLDLIKANRPHFILQLLRYIHMHVKRQAVEAATREKLEKGYKGLFPVIAKCSYTLMSSEEVDVRNCTMGSIR